MVSPHFVIRQPSRLKWALCSGEWLMITPRLALPTAAIQPSPCQCVLSSRRTLSSSNPGYTLYLPFIPSDYIKYGRVSLPQLPSSCLKTLSQLSLSLFSPIWKRKSFSLVSIHCDPGFSSSPLFPLLPTMVTVVSQDCASRVWNCTEKSLKPSVHFPTRQIETDSAYLTELLW